MIVTRYMTLCSIERAECLAMMGTAQLIEFSRKFYGDVPAYQEQRAARHMATIIEALCDELEAARKKIERMEECSDRFNPDCECVTCEADPDDRAEMARLDQRLKSLEDELGPRPEVAEAVTG